MGQDANLTEHQREILFNKGTEAPFSGALLNNKDTGFYVCANCGAELFHSDNKYDSKSGWPSFDDVMEGGAVRLEEDTSHGMVRTEAVCASCGAHLGHLFNDGPAETTGQRYCINSASLNFKDEKGGTKPGNAA